MMIAHPPCTYLCSSGLHWNGRVEGRAALTEEALDFVRALMDAPIPRIAIENPVGCISTRIRKADQYVQPYDFGDDASKRTGLWLKGLPKLTPPKAPASPVVSSMARKGGAIRPTAARTGSHHPPIVGQRGLSRIQK